MYTIYFTLLFIPFVIFLILGIKNLHEIYIIKIDKKNNFGLFVWSFFIIKAFTVALIFPFYYLSIILLIFYSFLIIYYTNTEWGKLGLVMGIFLMCSFCYSFYLFKESNWVMRFFVIIFDLVLSIYVWILYILIDFIIWLKMHLIFKKN